MRQKMVVVSNKPHRSRAACSAGEPRRTHAQRESRDGHTGGRRAPSKSGSRWQWRHDGSCLRRRLGGVVALELLVVDAHHVVDRALDHFAHGVERKDAERLLELLKARRRKRERRARGTHISLFTPLVVARCGRVRAIGSTPHPPAPKPASPRLPTLSPGGGSRPNNKQRVPVSPTTDRPPTSELTVR